MTSSAHTDFFTSSSFGSRLVNGNHLLAQKNRPAVPPTSIRIGKWNLTAADVGGFPLAGRLDISPLPNCGGSFAVLAQTDVTAQLGMDSTQNPDGSSEIKVFFVLKGNEWLAHLHGNPTDLHMDGTVSQENSTISYPAHIDYTGTTAWQIGDIQAIAGGVPTTINGAIFYPDTDILSGNIFTNVDFDEVSTCYTAGDFGTFFAYKKAGVFSIPLVTFGTHNEVTYGLGAVAPAKVVEENQGLIEFSLMGGTTNPLTVLILRK